jgi:26S proteasome regulatory subunit N6
VNHPFALPSSPHLGRYWPCSYFYEALENFDAISHARGVDCLKYMLLCKIMMNSPDEVSAIINGKPGMRHQGPAIEAMRAVAIAHQHRSLNDFESALATHAVHLRADPIISTHLNALYDMLLQENIRRIIEPYSRVETGHIAALMKLPLRQIEEKLSQMILDKKFKVALPDVAMRLTATLLFHTHSQQ